MILLASFQKTISDILINKLEKAIKLCNKKYPTYENVVIVGGVASNNYLRNKVFKAIINKKNIYTSCKLCTDNGAMIAWAGYERYKVGLH